MKRLNLGCGKRYHSDWINVDFISVDKNVIAHDLKSGIPFPDRSFDVVYHSHLLEHFSKPQAEFFINECYRVLKPHGILRVVVPDLEEIAKVYIKCIDLATKGETGWANNYNWILLELFDQMVRTQTGGEMINFLSNPNFSNQDFVLKRCGSEIKNILFTIQNKDKINESNFKDILRKTVQHIGRLLDFSNFFRQTLLKLILTTNDYESLKIGRFRQSGEVHQWMYDRYSLKCLLGDFNFIDIVQRSAHESYIPNWQELHLDTEPDGSIYKPDSLFMEAVKPN